MEEALMSGFLDELDKIAAMQGKKEKKPMSWPEKAAIGLLIGIPTAAGAYHYGRRIPKSISNFFKSRKVQALRRATPRPSIPPAVKEMKPISKKEIMKFRRMLEQWPTGGPGTS